MSSQKPQTDSCKKDLAFIQLGLFLSHTGLHLGISASVRLRLVYFSMLYVVILLWEFMPDEQGMVEKGSLEKKQKAFSGLFLIRQASTKVAGTTAGHDSKYK